MDSIQQNRRPLDPDLHAAILKFRETVIDLDVRADDARADLNRAITYWHEARRERDSAAGHLQALISMATDGGTLDETADTDFFEGVGETFGPEIAAAAKARRRRAVAQ